MAILELPGAKFYTVPPCPIGAMPPQHLKFVRYRMLILDNQKIFEKQRIKFFAYFLGNDQKSLICLPAGPARFSSPQVCPQIPWIAAGATGQTDEARREPPGWQGALTPRALPARLQP
jgi:hypothetical protein